MRRNEPRGLLQAADLLGGVTRVLGAVVDRLARRVDSLRASGVARPSAWLSFWSLGSVRTHHKNMKTKTSLAANCPRSQMVDAQTLLEILFDDRSRPSLRSIRSWTRNKVIPCIRCGGLVFYEPDEVRLALAERSVRIESPR